MKKILILFFILFALFFGSRSVFAAEKTTIYFFWGQGCPHCDTEKIFLAEMEKKYPELEIKSFETWYNQENAKLFQKMTEAYGIQAQGVPATFIGNYSPIIGYAGYMAKEIEDKIAYCVKKGCPDPAVVAGIIEPKEKIAVLPKDQKTEEKIIDANSEAEEYIEKINKNNDEILEDNKIVEEPKKEIKNGFCLHFFYRHDCPQCLNAIMFIDVLEKKYGIDIKRYNINSEEGKLIYQMSKEKYGLTTGAYPIVFIGEKYLIGEKAISNYLEKEIIFCQKNTCPCPLDNIKGSTPFLPQSKDITPDTQSKVNLPIIGEIDFSATPLFFTTAIIAFVDGFNPCSLWLITFLLGIVIYSGSKKKIFLVGATFLLVTGTAYALFMIGLLNVFLYIGYLKWIRIVVALMALIFAAVNIKDYFWYKKGLSFTISDKYKPKLFKNVRNIMKGDKSTLAMIFGTAVMALGVVLVELPCTAGFPVIWTNIIAQHHTQAIAYIFLLALYMIIYLFDEVIVLVAATITLKASRFEEKHGRILKLIGGMIMLTLALVMLINPDLMNNISSSLLTFAVALMATFAIIFIHRWILPKFGIKIGTEKNLVQPETNEPAENQSNNQSND